MSAPGSCCKLPKALRRAGCHSQLSALLSCSALAASLVTYVPLQLCNVTQTPCAWAVAQICQAQLIAQLHCTACAIAGSVLQPHLCLKQNTFIFAFLCACLWIDLSKWWTTRAPGSQGWARWRKWDLPWESSANAPPASLSLSWALQTSCSEPSPNTAPGLGFSIYLSAHESWSYNIKYIREDKEICNEE